MFGFISSISAALTRPVLGAIDLMPAALKAAAGAPTGHPPEGFQKMIDFVDKLAGYLIPVGASAAVLGLLYGGCLLMFGAPHAGKTLTYVILGVIVVVASQGLAK